MPHPPVDPTTQEASEKGPSFYPQDTQHSAFHLIDTQQILNVLNTRMRS